MRVHFIIPPVLKKNEESGIAKMYPPLGVLYLASYARTFYPETEFKITNGYNIGLKRTLKEIKNFNADIIGLSFSTHLRKGAYKIINEVKRDENIIVCGGPHPTAKPEEVLENCKTDIVCIGEGEVTFKEILDYANKNKNIEEIDGVYFKKNNAIKKTKPRELINNIDSIPFPARDLVNMKEYRGYMLSNKKDMHYLSSRGCPFQCVFCSNPVWQRKWRVRSPENVVDEIEELKKLGAEELFDESDTFNLSKKWAMDFCDEMIKRRINIPWKVQARIDNIDDELAKKMKEAGCYLVFLGIESANDRVLKGINKNIRKRDILRACRILKKYGIKVFGLIMIFNVWEKNEKVEYETVEECENTLNFTKYLVKAGMLYNTTWCVATPLPGSKLYDLAKKYNILKKEFRVIDWGDVWTTPFNLGISDNEVRRIKGEGAKIQTLCILKNKQINHRNIYYLFMKGMKLTYNTIKTTISAKLPEKRR